jgi:serine/threonine-protein kinase
MRACRRCGAIYIGGASYCGLDGEAVATVEHDPLVGATLDRYLVRGVLGDGGMARVYRAEHVHLAQPVALKVLFGDVASDQRFKDRFVREARAAAQVRHENVVEVRDFGVAPTGLSFLAMELLVGPTLSEARRSRSLSAQQIAAIVRQTAQGLAAAHRLGLVHRDLKPRNLMLIGEGAEPTVKILDFGLVRMLETRDERLTVLGQVLGSPAYMAPEQIVDGPIDARTDLYALGVILYELLVGRRPFGGDRDAGPAELADDPGLGQLALRLMSRSPTDRPSSAEEVVAAIDAIALPRPATTAPRWTPPVPDQRPLEPAEDREQLQVEAMVREAKPRWPQRVLLFGLAITAAATLAPQIEPATARTAVSWVRTVCAVESAPSFSAIAPEPAAAEATAVVAPVAAPPRQSADPPPKPRAPAGATWERPRKATPAASSATKSKLLPRLPSRHPPAAPAAEPGDDPEEPPEVAPRVAPPIATSTRASTATTAGLEAP